MYSVALNELLRQCIPERWSFLEQCTEGASLSPPHASSLLRCCTLLPPPPTVEGRKNPPPPRGEGSFERTRSCSRRSCRRRSFRTTSRTTRTTSRTSRTTPRTTRTTRRVVLVILFVVLVVLEVALVVLEVVLHLLLLQLLLLRLRILFKLPSPFGCGPPSVSPPLSSSLLPAPAPPLLLIPSPTPPSLLLPRLLGWRTTSDSTDDPTGARFTVRADTNRLRAPKWASKAFKGGSFKGGL